MVSFNFIASNRFELDDFKNISKFIEIFPDFQTVVLKDENELNLLLTLMGIEEFSKEELIESKFTQYWNLSNCKFPVYNEEQFDLFYNKWIEKSGRDNTMDEFGSLTFLQGLSPIWNTFEYRIIVKEYEEI